MSCHDFREALQLLYRTFARRDLKVVQYEQTSTRRNMPLQGIDMDRESLLALEVPVRNSNAAMELDLRFVNGITRVRVEHLITWVHRDRHELPNDGFAARLDGDVPAL